MVEKKVIDQLFMILFGVFGAMLFGVSANSFNVMKNTCTAPIIYNGMVTVMILGACLLTVALAYFFCNWKGGQCYSGEKAVGVSEFYLGIAGVFSLIMSILLAVMGSKLKDYPDCVASGVNLRVNIWFMFTLCFALFIACSTATGYIITKRQELVLAS